LALIIIILNYLFQLFLYIRRKYICNKYQFTTNRIKPLFGTTEVIYHGVWNGYKVEVIDTYSTNTFKRATHTITGIINANNPNKVQLIISIKGMFSKEKRYFGNANDRYYSVKSNPYSFGKRLLESTIQWKKVLPTQFIIWIVLVQLLGGEDIIRIEDDGRIIICAMESFTERKMKIILNIGTEIADVLKNNLC